MIGTVTLQATWMLPGGRVGERVQVDALHVSAFVVTTMTAGHGYRVRATRTGLFLVNV